ncbi:hypothetical protein ACFSTE_02830 [Aquimarina hainanensis]|uniref:Uncharacterized protein n=1 Tax=Aquimarina hainanensis TaxID=1578017 RepID=A0ABW5N6B5_9FLAO
MITYIVQSIAIISISYLLITKRKKIKGIYLFNCILLLILSTGFLSMKIYKDHIKDTAEHPTIHSLYHNRTQKGLFDLAAPLQKTSLIRTSENDSIILKEYRRQAPFLQKVTFNKKTGVETNTFILSYKDKVPQQLSISYNHYTNNIAKITRQKRNIPFRELYTILRTNGLLTNDTIIYGTTLKTITQ